MQWLTGWLATSLASLPTSIELKLMIGVQRVERSGD